MNEYYHDGAIEKIEDDELGRGQFIKALANSMLALKSTDTFTIGLYGKWGCGKTSILNMLLEELKNKQQTLPADSRSVIMQFEPWNFSNTDQLINQFFKMLSAELNTIDSEKLKHAGQLIKRYSSIFEEISIIPYLGMAAKIISAFGNALEGEAEDKTLFQLKKEITKELSEQGRKIIIIIDDIDRLPNEQIRLIFQLVKAVADFPNVIYLLSFDREIVCNALGAVQDCDGQEYLQKFIQLEFHVPGVGGNKVLEVLDNSFSEIVKDTTHVQDEQYKDIVFSKCITPYIYSLRDVKRTLNAFQFKYNFIKSEINPYDLLAMTVLQLFDPVVYGWIVRYKHVLIGYSDFISYFNANVKEERKQRNKEYLREIYVKSSRSDDELNDIIAVLFPIFAKDTDIKNYEWFGLKQSIQRTRICKSDKFDLYFTLSLDAIVIPLEDIIKAIHEFNQDDFKAYLENLFKDDLAVYFLNELENYIKELSIDRTKLIVKSIFDGCYKLIRESGKTDTGVFDYIPKCINVCHLLFENLKDSKMKVIDEILRDANEDVLQLFIDYLWICEIDFERVDKKDSRIKQNPPKVDFIEESEKLIIPKLRSFSSTTDIFDNTSVSRRLLLLWFAIDQTEAGKYIEKYINEPLRLIKFIEFNVDRVLSSSGYVWAVFQNCSLNEEYVASKYLVDEIKSMNMIQGFNALPAVTKKAFAAYILWIDKKTDSFGYVPDTFVNEMLNEWESDI